MRVQRCGGHYGNDGNGFDFEKIVIDPFLLDLEQEKNALFVSVWSSLESAIGRG
ncbi:hypothetical protein [Nonomuraea aridisoli]|uniref:hypothetical protein n=1 Tax=Nonomuraea aridisoli TaxID=2070368 RepID=UPI0015E8BB88|nr:hypothetical protein [Nonomuraea aridisoli]